MSKLCFLFFVFFGSFIVKSQGYNYYRLDTVKIPKIKSLEKPNFYAVTVDDFKYYMKQSTKKYHIVYTFTDHCKSCKVELPLVVSFGKQYENKIDIFYLSDLYSSKQMDKTYDMMKSAGSDSYVFNILDDKNKYNEDKHRYVYYIKDLKTNKDIKVDRYSYFTQKLAPNHKEYGYSLILLYDNNNKLLYASTYNEKTEEIFDKIKKIIAN